MGSSGAKKQKKVDEDDNKKQKHKAESEKFDAAWKASAKDASSVQPEKGDASPAKKRRKSKADATGEGAPEKTSGAADASGEANKEGKEKKKKKDKKDKKDKSEKKDKKEGKSKKEKKDKKEKKNKEKAALTTPNSQLPTPLSGAMATPNSDAMGAFADAFQSPATGSRAGSKAGLETPAESDLADFDFDRNDNTDDVFGDVSEEHFAGLTKQPDGEK